MAHDVWKETDGNPLFVREMVRHLVETGRVGTHSNNRRFGFDDSTKVLPSSLREVTLAWRWRGWIPRYPPSSRWRR